MAYSTRIYPPRSYGLFPPGVKWLLISNVAIWLLYYFATFAGYTHLWLPFGLSPSDVIHRFSLWQLVTYMFLHDPFGIWHILLNMLALWMFGAELERTWGTRQFLRYYFLCGIGAGLVVVLFTMVITPSTPSWTIGASGAIYGLLLAYGYLFPDREIWFYGIFAIKAKYFVMIFGAIAFLLSFQRGSGVSHIAHLSGMLIGYTYLRSRSNRRRPAFGRVSFTDSLRQRYKDWKIQRARRKFEVYMKERDRNRDKFVH